MLAPLPKPGDFLVYVPGCGDDDIFPSREDAHAHAVEVQGEDTDFPVFVVQVVEAL